MGKTHRKMVVKWDVHDGLMRFCVMYPLVICYIGYWTWPYIYIYMYVYIYIVSFPIVTFNSYIKLTEGKFHQIPWNVIFLWFSYGFPMVFPMVPMSWSKNRSWGEDPPVMVYTMLYRKQLVNHRENGDSIVIFHGILWWFTKGFI